MKNNIQAIRGYKQVDESWCDNDGNVFDNSGLFEAECDNPADAQAYSFAYRLKNAVQYFNQNYHVLEVIAYGDIAEVEGVPCATALQVVREIPWDDVLELLNSGEHCTGCGNSGDFCTGDDNSGDWNSGHSNSGCYNLGSFNSGDWNGTNHSSGVFNTVEQPIMMFDKPSKWTYKDWVMSRASSLLNNLKPIAEWVSADTMSEDELDEHPDAELRGGYLKHIDRPENQLFWNSLSAEQKGEILRLPNFDAYIFKKMTGIDSSK